MREDKLTTIIVDDEESAVNLLTELVEEFNSLEIIGTYTDPAIALNNINQHQPDLLFLDIKMPNMDGFELAKKVRSASYSPFIVFVTAFEKFAIKAINEADLFYIAKPPEKKNLTEVLEKVLCDLDATERLQKLENLFENLKLDAPLKFNTSTGFIRINPSEIIYLEADGNYCDIFMTDQRNEVVTLNMNNVNKLLNQKKFFRISRFNIINLSYLTRVERRTHSCFLYCDQQKYELKISTKYARALEKII